MKKIGNWSSRVICDRDGLNRSKKARSTYITTGSHIEIFLGNDNVGDIYLTKFNTIDSLAIYESNVTSEYSIKYHYDTNYFVKKFLSSNARDSIYVTDTSLIKYQLKESGIEDTSFCYVENN